MPFEAATVRLPGLGNMLVEQTGYSANIAAVPCFLCHVNVIRVQRPLQLLLFGGELIGEGFDFIALPDRLLLLLLRGGGIGNGLLLVGFSALSLLCFPCRSFFGLAFGCCRAHSLPGTYRRTKKEAHSNCGSGS